MRLRELQELLDSARKEYGVVGATLGVLGDGSLTTCASGVLNRNTRVECTADSVFQIGSITKVFTATLLMQLVEQERLDIDDPVIKYIPEFTLADRDAAQAVTVRQLLNHTSGIDGDFFPSDDSEGPSTLSYVRKMCLLPSVFAPGAGEVTYSNSAYVVAGRIVEVLTGMSWQQAVIERICKPLRLPQAFAHAHLGLRFRCAIGHVPSRDGVGLLVPTEDPYLPMSLAPAGTTLSMSAESLLLFAQAHLTAGTILSAESARRMQEERVSVPPFTRRGVTHWGLGWFLGETERYRMAGHDGGTIGQFAYLRVFPARGCAFALLMNSFSEPMAQELEAELMHTLIGEGVVPDPAAVRWEPRVEDYVGRYQRIGAVYRVSRGEAIHQLQLHATMAIANTREIEAILEPYRPDVFEVRVANAPGWLGTKVSFRRTGDNGRVTHLRVAEIMAKHEC